MKRLLTACLFVSFLSGCASHVALTGLDYSFRLLISAIQNTFPGGASVQSANSREWLSPPFTVEGGKIGRTRGADRAPVRAQAYAVILGDRRPYRVEVRVVREERFDNSRTGTPVYRRVGYDEKLTDELATQLDEYLSKSRENRDLIDDFRAF